MPAAFYLAPFQIDHVIARQHGGLAEAENLALACIHCSRFKGPYIPGADPHSGEIVRLLHPLVGSLCVGRTGAQSVDRDWPSYHCCAVYQ